MAQRDIREYNGKLILHDNWETHFGSQFTFDFKSALYKSGDSLTDLEKKYPWLKKEALVVKPDMLFGKRGINGLVYLKDKKVGDVTLSKAKTWIKDKSSKEITLKSGITGQLNTFILEPFCPHDEKDEYYIAASTSPEHDILYISSQGGVNIEENWDSITELKIPLKKNDDEIKTFIEANLPKTLKDHGSFNDFAWSFYSFFRDNHFSYLELNPFVLSGNTVHILDMVAKLDDTARFLMKDRWDHLEFQTPFGQKDLTEEEKLIRDVDSNSGASLKLTLLKSEGRIWTLVAGGGASVVFADTIADTWGVEDLANYGEYSGNPTTEETYIYADTVIDLMTRKADKEGKPKILIIGGAIANFTDVAKTFTGIVKAFKKNAKKMLKHQVHIYVRRGGPNFQRGLKIIREEAENLGLPIKVFGPSTHLTQIVKAAQDEHQ